MAIILQKCALHDIDNLLRVEPFRDWLKDVHSVVTDIVRHMIEPHGGDDRTIDKVQQVSMHIWRHARRLKLGTAGQLMNATWSDEYFTINIPTYQGDFGVVRVERGLFGLDVFIGFPNEVEWLTAAGLGPLGDKSVHYMNVEMRLRQAGLLAYAEYLKAGRFWI